MTGLFAGLLALGAASSASPGPVTVAGTSWELAAPTTWTAADRARLDGVAARLPARLREARVTLARGAAPTLPADLTTPHTVVRPAFGALVVGVEGLEDRVADAAVAERLLARQLVHALAHRLDAREGWSRSAAWRDLSGWGPVGGPAEEDTLSFATPHGRASAREDLATLAELYFVPEALPGETLAAPRCRVPSKWRFLEARVGPPAADDTRCATLAEVGLDPDAIEAIEVLYARASARSPASLVGHLLVALVYAPTATTPGRTDVYELAATTDGAARNTPGYVLRGLFGGFGSRVQREPLRFAVLRYAGENRGLQRFRLHLDAEQERALLARLDELRQGWSRPYLFLERNCTHLPKELLEAALGVDLGLPAIYGPDALLGEVERRGILEPMPATSLEEHSAQDRAALAARLRDDAAAALIAARPDLAPGLAAAFADTRARRAEDRARGYAALGELAAGAPAELDAALLRYLAWSDQVENLRFVRLGTGMPPEGDPAVRALWAAMAAARTGEEAEAAPEGAEPEGADPEGAGPEGAEPEGAEPEGAEPEGAEPESAPPPRAGDPTGDAALMGLLGQTERRGTTHTPLRRLAVGSVVDHAGGATVPGLTLGSHLYGFEMGEARRYAAATGTAVHLLPWELGISLEAEPALEAHVTALTLRRIVGAEAFGNTGYYADLADVNLRSRGGSVVTGLDAGVALELWQHDEHRHHVALTGGVALGSGDYGGRGWRGGLGLPVRLFARFGSATQALTALELEATWQPTWTADDAWSDADARLGGRLRLGEVADVDVALAADYRVATELGAEHLTGEAFATGAFAASLAHEGRLGVWLEPH